MIGLIAGFMLDGRGGGRRVGSFDAADRPTAGAGGAPVWLHLDRTRDETHEWLERQDEIPPSIRDALLEEDTRPRCVVRDDGIMLILRGINFDREHYDGDTIAVRVWVTRGRVISLVRYEVRAVADLTQALEAGTGPVNPAAVVVGLIDRLVDRIGPEVDAMEEDMDEIEDRLLTRSSTPADRGDLTRVRRRALGLHRYLHPQREALEQFRRGVQTVLPEIDPHEIGELCDHVTRLVEDLETLRSRAQIVEDSLSLRAAERMNQNMYWLSIIAALFMPLGFITGLLGVNVFGIPGAEDPQAFLVLCGLLGVLVLGEIWLMRRLGMF